MTILDAMTKAALRIYGQRPQVFFTAQGQFEAEIADMANVVASDIVAYRDWQALTKIAEITGNGVVTEFPLPDDYDKMLLDSEMSIGHALGGWRYRSVPDVNEFLHIKDRFSAGFGDGAWCLIGGEIHMTPAPSSPPIRYPYSSSHYATDAGGVTKPEFTADSDTFFLPNELLTLGIVWRWRENKKLDASGDQEAFIKKLDEIASRDKGSRVQRRNAAYFPNGVRTALYV